MLIISLLYLYLFHLYGYCCLIYKPTPSSLISTLNNYKQLALQNKTSNQLYLYVDLTPSPIARLDPEVFVHTRANTP